MMKRIFLPCLIVLLPGCPGGDDNASGPGGSPSVQFYSPAYTPYGAVSEVCLNPLRIVEMTAFLNDLQDLNGASIVQEEAGDYQAGTPGVSIEEFDSFGSHVAYVILKDPADYNAPDTYELWYDKTKIYDGQRRVNVRLFGDNILHVILDDSGTGGQVVFNNSVDALAGYPKTDTDVCYMASKTVACLRGVSGAPALYELGTFLGTPHEHFGFDQYENYDSHISQYNLHWYDDQSHVKVLLLGGMKIDSPAMGLNNTALKVIQIDPSKIIDLGKTDEPDRIQMAGNHVAFTRCGFTEDAMFGGEATARFQGYNQCHVIYDGVDVGPGNDPAMFGDHLAFTTIYNDSRSMRSMIVYDNKVIDVAKELKRDPATLDTISGLRIFGSHIAYALDPNFKDILEQRVVYDGKDMGPGNELTLFGDHIVFHRNTATGGTLILDGEDVGEGGYEVLFNGHLAFEVSGGNVSLDGKIYAPMNENGIDDNVIENMRSCRRYHLENEVPGSEYGKNQFFAIKRFDTP